MTKPNFDPDDERPDNKIREYLTDRGYEPIDFPERLDWIATRVVKNEFTLNSGNPINTNYTDIIKTGETFQRGCDPNYREGIAELLGIDQKKLDLPDRPGRSEIGELVYNFTDLSRDFEEIEKNPGEALIQYVNKRSKRESKRNAEEYLPRIQVDAGTPRELIQQLSYNTDSPGKIIELLNNADAEDIEDSLAKIQLADKLWPHQREALEKWIKEYDKTGYVKMATASGKTVLGIAAIACTASEGSDWMHENDDILDDIQADSVPSGSDFLVIMDSNLLKNQWIDMVRKHCYVPDDYTKPTEDGFQFPWGTVEFKTIQAVETWDVQDYDLVVFDEFHEYVNKGEYRDVLRSFIGSDKHVLALSASDEDVERAVDEIDAEFERMIEFTLENAIEAEKISDFDWEVHYTSVVEDAPGLDKIERANELWERRIEESESGVRLKGISNWINEVPIKSDKSSETLDQDFDRIDLLVNAIEDVVDEQQVGDQGRVRDIVDIKGIFKGYRQHWWNLRPSHEKVVSLIEKEVEKGRPCIIFTNSYEEAASLERELSHLDSIKKVVLEPDPDKNNELRNEYNDHDTDEKILIGPKRVIGKGTDLPEAEVGMNLAGTKKGVNQALVQMVGRILRREGGKGTFYNIKGLPEEDLLLEIDTPDIVGNICEFRSEGNKELGSKPSIVVDENRYKEMTFVERSGVERLNNEELTPEEKTLKDAIQDQKPTSDDIPTVTKIWSSEQSPQRNNGDVKEELDSIEQAKDSGREVQIDPVVYALVQAATEEDQTKSSLVDSALERYVEVVAEKSVNSAPEKTVPERDINVDLDPLLGELVQLRADDSGLENPDEFIENKLLNVIDIPKQEKSIVIPRYERYEIIVDKILTSGPAWAEEPSDVVEAALTEYFNIRSTVGDC